MNWNMLLFIFLTSAILSLYYIAVLFVPIPLPYFLLNMDGTNYCPIISGVSLTLGLFSQQSTTNHFTKTERNANQKTE